MEEKLICKDGMVNRGNWARIKSVMKRAENGESVRIAFLGGSITQGCNATKHEGCYSYLTYEWFKQKYPNSEVVYINAGIGGTTSQFGVARVDKDVFSQKPDMIFIEFTVNDDNTDFFKETYEGLIRHVYYHESNPAVMLIHNIKYDDGANAFEKHIEIGKYYELPCCSIITTVYAMVQRGEVESLDITTDNLHPNDRGHRMLADVITYYLNEIDKDKNNDEDVDSGKKAPLTANKYENSVRYQSADIGTTGNGFTADSRPKDYYLDNFKGGWTAKDKDSIIEMKVNGSGIAIQYKQTINKPAPVAIAYVDGDEKNGIILDANFKEEWGDNLRIDDILIHGEDKEHTVTIKITEAHEDDKSEFYLLSVIASK